MTPKVQIKYLPPSMYEGRGSALVYCDDVLVGDIVPSSTKPGLWIYLETIPCGIEDYPYICGSYKKVCSQVETSYLIYGMHEAGYTADPYLALHLLECWNDDPNSVFDAVNGVDGSYSYRIYESGIDYVRELIQDLPCDDCSIERFLDDWLSYDMSRISNTDYDVLMDSETLNIEIRDWEDLDLYTKTVWERVLDDAGFYSIAFVDQSIVYFDDEYQGKILTVKLN